MPWVAPACPDDGPVVRPVVRSSVIRSAIRSVVWSVVRFVGWSILQSVVRSVQSVVRSKRVLLHTQYSIQWPAGFRCLDIGRASPGFRTVWCCGGVAVLRKGCSGVAVVRLVVPVDGPVGGPVGGPVSGPVSGLVGGLVCGLVDGPVCGSVRAVCGPSKHVLLHTMACQLRMLGYWSQVACVFL